MGTGNRISGGWELTGVSIPANGTVRARGFVTGGQHNGSGWFVESLLAVVGPPIILTQDGHFGFTSNRFGFNVRAQAGQVVVVEASTNLVHWVPIHTNLLNGLDVFLFCDMESGLYARRYYRVRLYEGALPPPAIGGGFGFADGRFGFNVGGVSGQSVIVEASTNLVNWLPLQTNALGIGGVYFTDPGSTDFRWRFYRARVEP